MNKVKRVCLVCGKPFYGTKDLHYCFDCAKAKKLDTVLRDRRCQDCGIEFYGGPRAKRCPECAYTARQEATKRHRRTGTIRPIGSTDRCVVCGSDYIVISSRQKYCSENCQRIGILDWQRKHKRGYAKVSGQTSKKQERRNAQQKICAYCSKAFQSSSATNVCSEYCRTEYKRLQQCRADIRRGYNRDLQKYIDKMTEYRKTVNPGLGAVIEPSSHDKNEIIPEK